MNEEPIVPPGEPVPFGLRPASGTGARRTPSLGWIAPGGLVELSFVNTLLKIVTLGVYQFWGRAEVRKRIWSGVRIDGEPLEYTGTGLELFKGFLIVFGIVLLPALLIPVAAVFAFGPESPALVIVQILIGLLFIYLFGVGVFRAQRYRLTRTRWRGIRGGVEGSSGTYAWTMLWTAMLIPFTLGWIYPWRQTRLQRLLIEKMRFGDGRFTFEENASPLYARFIALWVGALVGGGVFAAASAAIVATHGTRVNGKMQLDAFGAGLTFALVIALYLAWVFASSWYRAQQFNHFARSTSFAGAPFAGRMTGTGLLWLSLSNFLLTIATLGIMAPVAQARAARYFVEHLRFDGPLPLDEIAQAAADGRTQGEGLAQAFDFDAF